jgi:hypothetical protein
MSEKTYLRVPGQWLEACGHGTEDRVFPIIKIDQGIYGGRTLTFVTVNRDGAPWVVHKETRKAEYVHVQ